MDDETLKQIHAEFAVSIEQALATLAVACARQLDAARMVNAMQGMSAALDANMPAPLRRKFVDAMCSAVEALAMPAPPAGH